MKLHCQMHQNFDPKWVSADDIIKCFTFSSFLLISQHLWQHYYSITAKYTLQRDPNWDAFQNVLLSTPLCVVYQRAYWQMGYPHAWLPLRSYTKERKVEHRGTLEPWKLLSEAGSSVLSYTDFLHTMLRENTSVHLICTLMRRSCHYRSLILSSRALSVGRPWEKQGKGREVRIYFRFQNTNVFETVGGWPGLHKKQWL